MKILKVFKSENDAMAAFEECAVKLEKLRDKTGIKQQDLVKSCDFNQPTYSLFVSRSLMYIGENTLLRVCADCRVKVNGEYLPFNDSLKRPMINGKSFQWWMIHFTTFENETVKKGTEIHQSFADTIIEKQPLGQIVPKKFNFKKGIDFVEKNEIKPEPELLKENDILQKEFTNAELYSAIRDLDAQLNIRLRHIETMIQKLYPAGLK